MQTIDNIRQHFSQSLKVVEALLEEQLVSNARLTKEIGQHAVFSGGKRMRPLLVLAVAESLNGADKIAQESIFNLAASVELLHTATLLHDDVIDKSSTRRGRASANAQWNNSSSILVGDFIYSRAFQLLLDIGNIELLRLLVDTATNLAEGELLQQMYSFNPETNEAHYLQIITAKTGVLFGAATGGVALLTAQSPVLQEQLFYYGINAGIAFQLTDDLLDYRGDADALGKSIGSDIKEGRLTLPLIYALQHCRGADLTLLKDVAEQGTSSQQSKVLEILADCGAFDYSEKVAQSYHQKACGCLEQLPANQGTESLTLLADFMIARKV